jgi:hypothetical protein
VLVETMHAPGYEPADGTAGLPEDLLLSDSADAVVVDS